MKEGISPKGNRLSRADELEILEWISGGETRVQVASALGTTERTVGRGPCRSWGKAVEALASEAALSPAPLAARA